MTETIIIVGIGGVALFLWWRQHQIDIANANPPYLGAPAWPTMPPLMVPDVALPITTEQAATYYGVSATTLEQSMK